MSSDIKKKIKKKPLSQSIIRPIVTFLFGDRVGLKTQEPPLQSIIDQTQDGTFGLKIALSYW